MKPSSVLRIKVQRAEIVASGKCSYIMVISKLCIFQKMGSSKGKVVTAGA